MTYSPAGTGVGPRSGLEPWDEVWSADDLALDRIVAIERLRPVESQTPLVIERVVRKARIAARLHHTNIIALHDMIRVDGEPYLIMQYVEGGSLAGCRVRARCRP